MLINQDFLEFIKLLNIHNVEYIIVGAYVRSFYGRPRYTGDIDFLISTTNENSLKMIKVINEFGLESLGLKNNDFKVKGQTIQIGKEPRRIDILTEITGVDFNSAWKNKQSLKYENENIFFLSKDDYIINKKALGRHKDLADIEVIENIDNI